LQLAAAPPLFLETSAQVKPAVLLAADRNHVCKLFTQVHTFRGKPVQEPQSMEHAMDSAEFKISGCFPACRRR
jgi:hypothetical protein